MLILVVDDHPLYRDALSRVLAQVFPDAEVAHAGDCASALAWLRSSRSAALVLLDLALPGMHGRDGLARFRDEFPATRVVVVSATEDRGDVVRCLQAGASGFIPKSARTEVLAAALKLVSEGGVYLPSLLLEGATAPEAGKSAQPAAAAPSRTPAAANESLTPRERDVLGRLCAGESNKAIANKLGISEATVRTHLTNVFRVLGVANRTQAARAARQRGLVGDDF